MPKDAKDYQRLPKITRFTSVYKDTTSIFNGIWRLIVKWERSVYGLIWQELLIFLTLYFALSLLYRQEFIFYNPFIDICKVSLIL